MPPAFFLLTDFGLQDPYAGQMKAVLLSRVPQAQILDLSHG
ncbi:MAG: SAM-dependent chlorinase/fluorinase, partial [Desulfovermiculus sp.]